MWDVNSYHVVIIVLWVRMLIHNLSHHYNAGIKVDFICFNKPIILYVEICLIYNLVHH